MIRKYLRKWHRWLGIAAAVPAGIILISGTVLMLRREIPALQPPAARGSAPGYSLGWPAVLEASRGVADAEVAEAGDISKVVLLPKAGVFQVRARNGWQIQVDAHTGAVLDARKRWTGWWIQLHEGTLFSLTASYALFLPASVLLVFLWLSGVWLSFPRRPAQPKRGVS